MLLIEAPHPVIYSHYDRCSWTEVAEPYPSGLTKFVAKAVVSTLTPAVRRQPLDIAACAISAVVAASAKLTIQDLGLVTEVPLSLTWS